MDRQCQECSYYNNQGSMSKIRRRSKLHVFFRNLIQRFTNAWGKENVSIIIIMALLCLAQWQQDTSIFVRKASTIYPLYETVTQNVSLAHSEGPPSYLPLAQHLKNLNARKNKPSLDDMIYGSQKRTLPDLEPTINDDLFSCKKCVVAGKLLKRSKMPPGGPLHLARYLFRIVSLYRINSLLVLPCSNQAKWIIPTLKAIRKTRPSFKLYCAVPSDYSVVEMVKKYGTENLEGTQFVLYKPKGKKKLPQVDMMFTWWGLEKLGLDEIHKVFKDVMEAGIKYSLIGNTPGYENARMVESTSGTYSIVRPKKRVLNVRAFPFGFLEALKVIKLENKQILVYNTTKMRDSW